MKSVRARKDFLSSESGKSINYQDCVRLLSYDGDTGNKKELEEKSTEEYKSSKSEKEIWHQSTATTMQRRDAAFDQVSNQTMKASRL